jgi:hypothetical protein
MKGKAEGLALAALVALGPGPAAASTVSDCLGAIHALSNRTDDMLFLRSEGERSRSQLISLLSKAATQVDRADFKGALKHMDAYSTEVSRAIRAGNLRMFDAIHLQEDANAVIVCIAAIGK